MHGSQTTGSLSVRRAARGSAAIELPICILVLFIIFFFPMLDLAMCAVRAQTIYSCARDAARVAARASTFTQAKARAMAQVIQTSNASLTGAKITVSNVSVNVVGIPVNNSVSTVRQSAPLAVVDKNNYIYQIEVNVPGAVDPLVMLSSNLFGSIPGISAPMPVSASSREFAEHPNGLSK